MRIDAGKIIDNSRVNKLHVMIIAVGMLVLIIDSYDLVSMGLVIPRLADQWGIAPSEFAIALSVAMFGVMVGSGVAGILGDYIGRQRTMLLTVFVAGIFMLLTANANSMTELVIYRFITGVGAGGCIPITIAYAAEYMPERFRNRLVVFMYTGAGLGAVIAGFAAPTIMAGFGWQGVFVVGGVFSILILILIFFAMPESLRFLISRNVDSSVAANLLKRIDYSFEASPDDDYFMVEHTHSSSGSPVKELFGYGQTAITLLAWAVMLGNQFMVFLLALWLPTFLNQSGFELQTAIYVTALYSLGGVVGGIIFAGFADRIGTGRVLTFTYPIAGASVVALGLSLNSISALVAASLICGAFLIGSSFCLGPYVASMYPTRARSTGIGWALSVGRIGSILSPLVGGFALGQGYETSTILFAAGIPPVVCGLVIVALNRLIVAAAERQTIVRTA